MEWLRIEREEGPLDLHVLEDMKPRMGAIEASLQALDIKMIY
jgi:hypothetical protein